MKNLPVSSQPFGSATLLVEFEHTPADRDEARIVAVTGAFIEGEFVERDLFGDKTLERWEQAIAAELASDAEECDEMEEFA